MATIEARGGTQRTKVTGGCKPSALTAALEPKPTQQPPKASSIAGKTNLHQCQYDTGKTGQKTKGKTYFDNTGANKTGFLTCVE